MKLINQVESIKKRFSGKIFFNENLSKFSWFNIGGPAKVLFKPKNLKELSIFLKEIKGVNKIKVLGAGSNTLIRDGGFDGIVIKLGKLFSHLSLFPLIPCCHLISMIIKYLLIKIENPTSLDLIL